MLNGDTKQLTSEAEAWMTLVTVNQYTVQSAKKNDEWSEKFLLDKKRFAQFVAKFTCYYKLFM